MSKRGYIIIFVVVALFGSVLGIASTLVDTPEGKNTNTSLALLSSLDGHWVMKDKSENPVMFADIQFSKITVKFFADEMNGLYWHGDFTSDHVNGDTITSVGDTEAMGRSMFGSQSEQKMFTYKNGVLSFKFTSTGLGIDTTVELVKE